MTATNEPAAKYTRRASDNLATTLQREIAAHDGWEKLEEFGRKLVERPMEREGLKIFLASTSTFFKEIPGGILALALRVTDDWMTRDRFNAVGMGARVLLSAVDEYGLHEPHKGYQKTHHELFVDMTHMWGLSTSDLLDPKYVIPESIELAAVTRDFYRSRHLGEGLGFHFASEKTSDREFQLCMRGFTHFWTSYALKSASDPTLNFYHIHTLVEPMHGSTSADIVTAYGKDPVNAEYIAAGAAAFMEGYGQFWTALTRAVY